MNGRDIFCIRRYGLHFKVQFTSHIGNENNGEDKYLPPRLDYAICRNQKDLKLKFEIMESTCSFVSQNLFTGIKDFVK